MLQCAVKKWQIFFKIRKKTIIFHRKKLNILRIYALRYLKIMPSIAFVLFIEKFLIEKFIAVNYKAPFLIPTQLKYLSRSFWSNFLFLQNYIPQDTYLTYNPTFQFFATNFQFFLITPWMVWLMIKKKNLAKYIFGIVVAISIGINCVYLHSHEEYFRNIDL